MLLLFVLIFIELFLLLVLVLVRRPTSFVLQCFERLPEWYGRSVGDGDGDGVNVGVKVGVGVGGGGGGGCEAVVKRERARHGRCVEALTSFCLSV